MSPLPKNIDKYYYIWSAGCKKEAFLSILCCRIDTYHGIPQLRNWACLNFWWVKIKIKKVLRNLGSAMWETSVKLEVPQTKFLSFARVSAVFGGREELNALRYPKFIIFSCISPPINGNRSLVILLKKFEVFLAYLTLKLSSHLWPLPCSLWRWNTNWWLHLLAWLKNVLAGSDV